MAKVISILNQKGGVGKTTVTINFGIGLAKKGYKCLLIDFDPQGNLGNILEPTLENEDGFKNGQHPANTMFMFESGKKPTPKPSSKFENLSIIGSSGRLSTVTQEQVFDMADSLELIKDDFDIILIDCPPSVGSLQFGALAVSTSALIVTQPQGQSIKGVDKVVTSITQIKRHFNLNLPILGIVVNQVKRPTPKNEQEQIEIIKNKYANLLFESSIYYTSKVSESLDCGYSLADLSTQSNEHFGFESAINEFVTKLEK